MKTGSMEWSDRVARIDELIRFEYELGSGVTFSARACPHGRVHTGPITSRKSAGAPVIARYPGARRACQGRVSAERSEGSLGHAQALPENGRKRSAGSLHDAVLALRLASCDRGS